MNNLLLLCVSVSLFTFGIAGCQSSSLGTAKTTPSKLASTTEVEKIAESVEDPELGGYCPVALVESGRLVKGLPGLQFRYDGRVYQMAHDAAALRFINRPSRYVPPFATIDPVNFAQSGERTSGSLNLFALHERKAWFFLSEENRKKFLSSPEPFIQNAVGPGPAAKVPTGPRP